MGSTGEVEAVIAGLRGQLAALADVDLAGLAEVDQLGLLRELQPIVWGMQAQFTRAVGVVNASGAVRVDAFNSTASWMKAHLRSGDGVTQIRHAKALAKTPEVAAASERGDISVRHVDVVAKIVDDIPDDVLAGGVDKILAEQAGLLAPKEFGAFAGQVRDICDPDAADRRHRKHHRESWLSVSKTIDDLVSVQGMLSAEHGELLLTALAALMPPPDADDPRNASQRRAGALADLCRLAANTAPVAGGEKPHLIVTMGLEWLRGNLNNTDTDHSYADPAGRGSATHTRCPRRGRGTTRPRPSPPTRQPGAAPSTDHQRRRLPMARMRRLSTVDRCASYSQLAPPWAYRPHQPDLALPVPPRVRPRGTVHHPPRPRHRIHARHLPRRRGLPDCWPTTRPGTG